MKKNTIAALYNYFVKNDDTVDLSAVVEDIRAEYEKSAAKVRSSVVRLITNSLVRAITSCEYLSGRIDTETITGSLQIVPAQAAVIMLLRPSSSAQLIMTAGTG